MKNFCTIARSTCKRPTGTFFKPRIQPKLSLGPVDDAYEKEADTIAGKIMQTTQTVSSVMRLSAGETQTADGVAAPSLVQSALHTGGQPMDKDTRNFMESRFGYDFNDVRIHNDSVAHRSSAEINALAYTHGNHIVFGQDQFRPQNDSGKQLLAHELTHVVQQNSNGERHSIQGYRSKDSANFKTCNTSTLKEDLFSISKDKEVKPWIEQITVHFNATTTDSDGDVIPTGTLEAAYYKGSQSNISSQVAGGKASQGLTDSKDSHKVLRIEGCGYHHTSVPKAERITGHKRAGKYFRDTSKATMNFAVFFVQGDKSGNQAIHQGSFQTGSLACVHVPDANLVQQINYHSVEKLTKVKVSYAAAALKTVCCERFKAVGYMVGNPCKGQNSKSCP